MNRYVIRVYGLVQGVGFRKYVKKSAIQLKIMGWVQNKQDGSVLIIAEGNEADLVIFLEKVKKGSLRAVVEKLTAKKINIANKYKSFRIKP